MNSAFAIQATDLGKRYRLGNRYRSAHLRETMSNLLAAPIRALRRSSQSPRAAEARDQFIWSLRDVSFAARHGEVLGVVGANGAGKSTLLKILARVTTPTAGRVIVDGRVGCLLEVGTGFHPELTGRDNIYLNGSVLGMAKSEIDRRFDAIVEFSGVARFLDTPVKRYSSGMYLRLAFAVASHLETPILIVDEVLAVGDLEFQKKCLGKMGEVAGQGRTVVFVSHNMAAVESLCTRALLLRHGSLVADGTPADVVNEYTRFVTGARTEAAQPATTPAWLDRLVIRDRRGEVLSTISPWTPCTINACLTTRMPLNRTYVNILIRDLYGRNCIHLRTDYDDLFPAFVAGQHHIAVDVASFNLEGGTYTAAISVVSPNDDLIVESDRLVFTIEREFERFEAVGAVVAVRHRWTMEALNATPAADGAASVATA